MQAYSIKAQKQPHNPFCSTCGSIGALYSTETDKLEACGECEMYEDICYRCGDSGEDIWGDECTLCNFNKTERV